MNKLPRRPPTMGTRSGRNYYDFNQKSAVRTNLPRHMQTNAGYKSTSDYLRVAVLGDSAQSRRSKSANSLPGNRMTVYTSKNPDDLHEEMMTLKRNLKMTITENSVLKTKIRRMEDENSKKSKQLDEFLDHKVATTFIDKPGDSKLLVNSLKQKIIRLEQSLKDKEANLNLLKADMKTTKMQEMRVQVETFYQEILRIQQGPRISNRSSNDRPSSSNELESKLKHLNETILRQNETNTKLMKENRNLQNRLENQPPKDESDLDSGGRKSESKTKLIAQIRRLEDELEIERNKDNQDSSKDSLHENEKSELKKEVDNLKTTIKRLKEDRQQFKSKFELKDREIITLKKQLKEFELELKEKDKELKTARGAYRRRSSISSNDKVVRNSNNVRENSNEVSPERSQSISERSKSSNRSIDKGRIELFRKNHAAKKIQKKWKNHREEQEMDEALDVIASAAHGHLKRKEYLNDWNNQEFSEDESKSSAIEVINAAARGHLTRKQYQHSDMNGSHEDENSIRSTSSRRHSRTSQY